MLGKLRINGKTIPLPIPLLSLGQALDWVEKTFAADGRSITKVCLDGKNFSAMGDLRSTADNAQKLVTTSILDVQVESAKELVLQTLDALRNLINLSLDALKPTAVLLWEWQQAAHPAQVLQVRDDLLLVSQLIASIRDMGEHGAPEMAEFFGISSLMDGANQNLDRALGTGNLREVARILLNRHEGYLLQLRDRCELLSLKLSGRHSSVVPVSSLIRFPTPR